MEILLYQIGIFIAIQIASLFGKSSRNVAIVLISIFTLLQVFTSALMILQFATIFISYIVSKNILEGQNNTSKKSEMNFGREYRELPKVKKVIAKSEEKFGREFGELPKTKNVSSHSYGLSSSNPLLMSSIPSSYRFLDSIIDNNPNLSYQRRGSTVDSNFSQPIDMYEFSKNGQKITMIYIYPYYNSNVEIVPNILK